MKRLFCKIINRYALLFISVAISSTITTFCYIPTFTLRKFPSEELYPLPTETLFVIFIYVMQVYVIVQCGLSCSNMNFLFAAFFLYSSARLEILCLEIQTAKNERQINSYIKKHTHHVSSQKPKNDQRNFMKQGLLIK